VDVHWLGTIRAEKDKAIRAIAERSWHPLKLKSDAASGQPRSNRSDRQLQPAFKCADTLKIRWS
jgi:hypothetical protein